MGDDISRANPEKERKNRRYPKILYFLPVFDNKSFYSVCGKLCGIGGKVLKGREFKVEKTLFFPPFPNSFTHCQIFNGKYSW